MADLRTTVTELTTGLGMLGFASITDTLTRRPAAMISAAPETWSLLDQAYSGGAHAKEFESAWENGRAFLEATDGLRGRRPVVVEWKGSHRAPGDEVAPIDLRIDHVFLVSCKYLSRITVNASPVRLFDRLLSGSHGTRELDWFALVAPEDYQRLYASVRACFGFAALPLAVEALTTEDRRQLTKALAKGWPVEVADVHRAFVAAIATTTARRWSEHANSSAEREGLLWRLLRMGSAPYFLLGSLPSSSLRIRVATPWDWRRQFRMRSFEIGPQSGGQPRIGWEASIEDRHSRELHIVQGHVEIRWSHGQFSGNPEAKVYLDTPHGQVPGYFPLR